MNQRFLQGLVDPGKNLLFFLVFGTFGLTLASDALSDLVLNRFGNYLETNQKISPLLFRSLIFLLSTGVIVIMVYLTNLSRWFGGRPVEIQPAPLKATFRALIVIASPGPGISSARGAIEHHWNEGKGNLEHCWIICGGEKSLESARAMIGDLPDTVLSIDKPDIEYVLADKSVSRRKLRVSLRNLEPPETDNPNATFRLVNSIYEEAERTGIPSEDVIADYTGGTKSMTAGMVLACANPDRLLAFMKPADYLDDGRADLAKPSIATDVKVNFQVKTVRQPRS